MNRIALFLFLNIISFIAISQNAKKYFSSGEKFLKVNNYSEAIASFSKCLELEPNFTKAYILRANCYEQIGKNTEAAEDFKKATAFSPKDKELYYNSGRLYLEANNYSAADEMLNKAIDIDDEYIEALTLRIKTLCTLKKFQDGLATAELALNIKKNAVNYYNRAIMYDSLKNYTAAEKDYKDSKYYDSKYIPAYVGLALVQIKLNKPDLALATCDAAIQKDAKNTDVFFTRSKVYANKNDLQNAINDISAVISANPNNSEGYFLRASYYQKLGQWLNASGDYTSCIKIDAKNISAFLARAQCFEQMNNFVSAINDYETVMKSDTQNESAKQLLSKAKEKLFELNRESNKPEIVLINLKAEQNHTVKIPGNTTEFVLQGIIKDASFIKTITANNVNAQFPEDSLNPSFSAKLNLYNVKEITVIATDLYNNTQNITYTIHRTEIDKPLIALTTPYTSFDNEIVLDHSNPELYVEGKIKDESIIESITIEGLAASFPLNSLNPVFSAKISIANKNKITVTAKDIYGNETVQEFKINREGAIAIQNNPMGNTWIVFIENSKYSNFSPLDGPEKDVMLMKSALANYKVSKIVHKKDMSKNDLEKFFAIELRDLVKNNNVHSLLIWYAGHGKFVNQTGYWIPTDAKVDDEFSYFNMNALRAYMQSYNKLIHTLVITDACESGQSFFLAARGKENRTCDNWQDTKFKSAQVFSSAGQELAADMSVFTKTFVSALNGNPEDCISIEKIAEKVSTAVKQSGKQTPKLGKIDGLPDEDGTFFFIKK